MILLYQRWPEMANQREKKWFPPRCPGHEVGPGTQPRTRIGACGGGGGAGRTPGTQKRRTWKRGGNQKGRVGDEAERLRNRNRAKGKETFHE